MPVALTVLLVDHIHGLLHLLDRRGSTGVQRPLHHRLLGTEASSERSLQDGIGSETTVDFHQPVSACQQADKGIVELVTGRVLDGLLLNAHGLADRTKHVQMLELHPQRCQARTRSKMTFRWCERIVFDDGPPLPGVKLPVIGYAPSSFLLQSPCFSTHGCSKPWLLICAKFR